MSKLTLVSKRNVGSNNFEYTFECFCSPHPVRQVQVTSGNDSEAEQLAQIECDEYCGDAAARSELVGFDGLQVGEVGLEDLLNQHSAGRVRALVRSVRGDAKYVEVVPWSVLGGYRRELAMTIAREAIAGVHPVHIACECSPAEEGAAALLRFKPDAVLPISEVMRCMMNMHSETRRSSLASARKLTTTTILAPRLAAAAPGWDIVQELELSGDHGTGLGEHAQVWAWQNQNPGGRVESNEEELKKDDDAHWQKTTPSAGRVEYRLWANNCKFSCDTVRLRVYIRWVNP